MLNYGVIRKHGLNIYIFGEESRNQGELYGMNFLSGGMHGLGVTAQIERCCRTLKYTQVLELDIYKLMNTSYIKSTRG